MFLISMIIALICLICSICININWIYDISCYLGYFLAIYLVTFIAIIPGFQYVFNFVSLLLHKNDKKKSYNKKEEDVTILLPVYNAKKSIETSLKKLQTDYIDLMLIHMPYNDYYSIYRALETAYKSGIVKSIGISNFDTGRYIDIIYHSEIKPVINQVETHVFNQQKYLQKVMKEYGTHIMAWAPFAEGKNDFFNNSILKSVGEKYNKTAAQIALRYLIQRGIIVIPKTINIQRMKENFNVFDFSISDEDMQLINSLDTKKAVIGDFNDIEYNKYVLGIKL